MHATCSTFVIVPPPLKCTLLNQQKLLTIQSYRATKSSSKAVSSSILEAVTCSARNVPRTFSHPQSESATRAVENNDSFFFFCSSGLETLTQLVGSAYPRHREDRIYFLLEEDASAKFPTTQGKLVYFMDIAWNNTQRRDFISLSSKVLFNKKILQDQ